MRRLSRLLVLCCVVALVAAVPGLAVAHDAKFGLDHPAPGVGVGEMSLPVFQAGPDEAEWELIATFPTGNPQTDLDFFTHDGDVHLAVGTLAVGPNAGGQTIFRVTRDGEVDPELVSSHPSAACISDPSQALGLQHDVQAYPKGDLPLHVDFGARQDRRDAQIILDATDAVGRCHDQGPLAGFADGPRGGLEIIDITDVAHPVEIALTSHIGQAHTVTVDPTRPIAYVASSDAVAIRTEDGEEHRANEDPDDQPLRLDGFEVVDFSSCIDFPAGTSVDAKRGRVDGELVLNDGCRPEIYRYRFEIDWTRGTFDNMWLGACHDLEVYPDDLLVCAALSATLVLDMSGAFDADGRPRGEPLPCRVRESTSSPPFVTEAPVVDCVIGEDENGDEVDLRIPSWLEIGAPSLEGVELVGFVNHGGRDGDPPAHHPSEDIEVAHEVEFSTSRNHLIVSDERGGAVVPPGASCVPDDGWPGNGGLHALRKDRLFTAYPGDPEADEPEEIAARAREAYALNPSGEPAIYRAQIRVPAATFCTAHVFRHIPGQNRIFMGWYTQGTQVVDYVEHPDGTFEWIEAGWFIPANANQWVSHVFHWEENPDGTFTYWGVAADFMLGPYGRNTVDFYRVTLPPPPEALAPEPPAPEPEPTPEPPVLPATGPSTVALAGVLAVLAAVLTALGFRRRRHPLAPVANRRVV